MPGPRRARVQLFVGVLAVTALCGPRSSSAGVGDPQIRTDDPNYPGELALSTPRLAVEAALAVPRLGLGDSERDRIIRLFLWRAEHFAHLESPALPNLPDVVPDPRTDDHVMADFDAMRVLFNYGWGLCGNNHAQMRVFADVLSWPSRRRALNGDAGLELFVDGGWRYVNVDQYTLHFLEDSAGAPLASVDEILTAPHHAMEWNVDLGLGHPLPQANTHGQYLDYPGVTRVVPNRSQQWRSYYETVYDIRPEESVALHGEAYAAAPMRSRLKRGETFTRYFGPRGAVEALGLAGGIWWGYNRGDVLGVGDAGPALQHSFVFNTPARDEVPGGPEESRGVQRYGNAVFSWRPDLARGELDDGVADLEGRLELTPEGALTARGPTRVTLLHQSPYTIAGRPLDGVDPASSAVDGARLAAEFRGEVELEISVDAGATWTFLGAFSGAAEVDFTDFAKAHEQYLLRLGFGDGEGLSRLELRTIAMLGQPVYPALRPGSTELTYAASGLAALDYSPNLKTPESAESATGWAQKVAESENVSGEYYAAGDGTAYRATNFQPLSLVYRIRLPAALAEGGARLQQISAAADANVNQPASGRATIRIEIAPSAGGPWTEIAAYTAPSESTLPHQWAYGESRGAALGGTEYFVRFTASDPEHLAGLRFLKIYATHAAPEAPADLVVTARWSDGAEREATHAIPAGVDHDTWRLDTGMLAAQRSITFAATTPPAPEPGPPDPPPSPDAGATDGAGDPVATPRPENGCTCLAERPGSSLPLFALGAGMLLLRARRPRR